LGIFYVDTLDALQAATRTRGHWLHYRIDAHPTAEGHEIVADTIVRAQVIRPQGTKPN
jgi:hypothetical protein